MRLREARKKRAAARAAIAKGVAKRLRAARERAGLRFCDLDAKAQLTGGHTRAIEEGARIDPSGQTILALADALGVTTDWLLRGSTK